MKISVDIALLYLVVSNPQNLLLIQSSQAFHSLYRYPHTLGYLPGWDKKALMNYWSKWLAKNLSGISLSLFPVCRPLLGAWVGWSLNSQATQPTQAMRPRLPDHRYDHRHRNCHRHHHKFLCYPTDTSNAILSSGPTMILSQYSSFWMKWSSNQLSDKCKRSKEQSSMTAKNKSYSSLVTPFHYLLYSYQLFI